MKFPVSLLLIFACNAAAQDALPKLELGASLFALSTPDYPGAESDSSYLIPIPYIKYRGDRLRVGDGVQGMFVETPDLLITLSGNASLPPDEDVSEREGMDDLDPILEVGPSVNYRFYRLRDSAWWVDLPYRFAYTLDSDLEHIGQVFNPRLTWRKPVRRLGQWKLSFNIGPLFANDEFNEYFYSVDAGEATADRPAYDADGGFNGWRTEFTYSKRYGKYWLGGFFRYDNLSGPEIDDSPLVLEEEAWVTGIALGYVFHER